MKNQGYMDGYMHKEAAAFDVLLQAIIDTFEGREADFGSHREVPQLREDIRSRRNVRQMKDLLGRFPIPRTLI